MSMSVNLLFFTLRPENELERARTRTRTPGSQGQGNNASRMIAHLPAIDGSSIPRITLHDPFVNLVQCHLLLRILQDSRRNQVGVRMGGLGIL